MAVTVAALDAVAQTLQVALTPSGIIQPGQLVQAALSPDPSSLTVTDFLSGPLEGLFISKDVRFVDQNVEPLLTAAALNPRILGGMPIVGGVGAPPPGVPGSLGQFTGSIPFPVEVPASIEVQWSARDAGGGALPAAEFAAPEGLTGIAASFLFAPAVFELGTAAPGPLGRRVHARVRVSSSGVNGSWIDLPDVPVQVAALPVPTIAAFFRHGNFAAHYNDAPGFILAVVPSGSPLGSLSQALSVLSGLQSALGALSQIARFASFATGISTLASVAAAQPNAKFRSTNSISNLNDITMIDGFWNDTEAEDEISSIIFVGRDTRALKCYNARGQNTGEGAFTITAGAEHHVLVPYLSSGNPGTQPANRLVVDSASSTFSDRLSSMQFA